VAPTSHGALLWSQCVVRQIEGRLPPGAASSKTTARSPRDGGLTAGTAYSSPKGAIGCFLGSRFSLARAMDTLAGVTANAIDPGS